MYWKSLYFYLFIHMCFEISLAKEKDIIESRSNCREALYNIDIPSIQDFRAVVQQFFDKALLVVNNFDPYSKKHLDLKYHAYGIESEGYLNELLVSGFSSLKLNHLSVDDDESLQISINITINHLQLLSSYNLNFDFLTMLPIYGSGDVGAAISAINLSFQSTFKQLMDERMQATDLQLDYSLGDFKVDISSLFNNTNIGSYLSRLLSKLLPHTINTCMPLKTYANIGAKAALNSVLCDKGITFKEVLDVMQGFIR